MAAAFAAGAEGVIGYFAEFAGIAIGLTLTLIHLVSIPVSNTSVNPARSLGVAWFAGGHDGGRIGERIRDEIGDWFTWYLGRDGALGDRGEDPGTGFAYAVESGVRASSRTPTGRTVEAADTFGAFGRRNPLHA